MHSVLYISSVVMALFCFVSTGICEDMVRVPSSGNETTGYQGCSFMNMSCAKSDVKAVKVKAFYMDVHEVTYQQLVSAGITGLNHTDKVNEPYQVSYLVAYQYCEAVGKRLPTEAEWLAAAMPNGIQNYTWGDNYIPTAAAQTLLIDTNKHYDVMSFATDYINGIYDLSGSGCEWINTGNPTDDISKCNEQGFTTYKTYHFCLGAAPLPLYQQIHPVINDVIVAKASFRCVKDE